MTIHTTTRIHLTLRDHARTWLAQRDPIALLFLALALIIAVALLRPHASPAIIAAQPTPQLPIFIVATAQAERVPTAAPVAAVSAVLPTTPRYVVAFASPDGAVLGPIPAPEASALLGRWGDGWVATIWEGATVWIRAADIGLNLANLAPAPAPAVQYQVVNQPPAPPTLTSDERQQALERQFGSDDITGGDALKAHQARQAEVDRQKAIQGHYANEHVPEDGPPLLTSDDLPCNCP